MKHRIFFFSNTSIMLRGSGVRLCAFTLIFILLLAFGLNGIKAQAQTYTEQELYSFGRSSSDGANPYASLIALNGKLYGTTSNDGTNNVGTVFAVNPDGTGYQTLYNFTGFNSDGAFPQAGLIALNGKLYGTTKSGGTNEDGTVFVINPNGTGYQTLYKFDTASGDGANPYAGLIVLNGKLYGTTSDGGTNEEGTLFAINPDGTEFQTLYSFDTSSDDGYDTYASLIAINGKLYGTTLYGGTNDDGTIFAINSDGTGYQTLHSFDISIGDGAHPYTGLITLNGKLYGTAESGGTNDYGTVFVINPDGSGYQSLYSFTGSNGDGEYPYAGLIAISGKFYATTYEGGTSNNGTVFVINPDGTGYQTLYTFQATSSTDGANPYASLTYVNGTLYGTTVNGGTNKDGTLFSLTLFPAPVASNDSARTAYNTTLTITAPGVLGNDKNASNATAVLVSNPAHGTITFHSDGSFVYVPTTGYLGTDSFTYQDTNAGGTSNVATCTITVQPRTPIAANDSGRTYYNTTLVIGAPGVLGNDKDGDNNTMTASLVSQPSHGTITFNSNGSFTYVPTAGFLGTDSFTYQAVNDISTSNVATCTLLVQARTPIANNDAGRVTHNNTLTITAPGVLGNDNAGDTGTITTTLVTGPSHGTISFHTDGSFVYKPTTGFIGTDSFTYKDTNAIGTSNTATCTLTVQ